MSQENVERFLDAAAAFNRADIDGASEGLDADVIFEPQAAEIEGPYAGPDGVRRFLTGLADLFEVFELRYEDVRDLGDRVLALGTVRTVTKGSGIEQESPLAVVAVFRHGRVAHWKDYGDADLALEAVGLRE
jgi:ketosteroid isomerase-like protein